MDYEVKYKEALKKAGAYHNDYTKDIIEDIFPELKESSSEDERIRKALIDYFRWNPDIQLLNEFSNREVFAWLEKQTKNELNTEDRCIIQDTISICERARKKATNEIDYENVIRCIDWLKLFVKRNENGSNSNNAG